MLITAIGIVWTRSLGWALVLFGAQSLMLATAALYAGLATSSPHIIAAAGLTMALKVIATPMLLWLILQRLATSHDAQPSVGQRTGVALAILIALVFARTLDARPFHTAIGAERVLPTAVTVMLIGIQIMVTHRQALSQVIGFLVLENGMALAGAHRDLRHAAGRRVWHLPRPPDGGLRRVRLHAAHARDIRLARYGPAAEAAGMIAAAVFALVVAPPRDSRGHLAPAPSPGQWSALRGGLRRYARRRPRRSSCECRIAARRWHLASGCTSTRWERSCSRSSRSSACARCSTRCPTSRTTLPRGELRRQDESRYYALFLVFMATMAAVPVAQQPRRDVGGDRGHHGGFGAARQHLPHRPLAGSRVEVPRAGLRGHRPRAVRHDDDLLRGVRNHWRVRERARLDQAPRRSVHLDPAVMRLAFIFILVGYGTKAGLAPMHTWLPDAHSQAPSPVSGLAFRRAPQLRRLRAAALSRADD